MSKVETRPDLTGCLLLDDALYKWSRPQKWRAVRVTKQQSSTGSGLWFKEILEDPDWVGDTGQPMTLADKYGNTLLHFAARSGNVSIIKDLIRNGHEVNAKNNSGETPLDVAERYQNTEAALELIRKGGKTGHS